MSGRDPVADVLSIDHDRYRSVGAWSQPGYHGIERRFIRIVLPNLASLALFASYQAQEVATPQFATDVMGELNGRPGI